MTPDARLVAKSRIDQSLFPNFIPGGRQLAHLAKLAIHLILHAALGSKQGCVTLCVNGQGRAEKGGFARDRPVSCGRRSSPRVKPSCWEPADVYRVTMWSDTDALPWKHSRLVVDGY